MKQCETVSDIAIDNYTPQERKRLLCPRCDKNHRRERRGQWCACCRRAYQRDYYGERNPPDPVENFQSLTNRERFELLTRHALLTEALYTAYDSGKANIIDHAEELLRGEINEIEKILTLKITTREDSELSHGLKRLVSPPSREKGTGAN